MDLGSVVSGVWRTLVFVAPSYFANGSPVVIAKVLGRTHPLDLGVFLPDGRRLFGDGKSWEGFLGGIGAGFLVTVFLAELGLHTIRGGIVLSVGAVTGDVLGSFVKRRLGLERGSSLPLVDQLSFLVIALVLYYFLVEPVDRFVLFISLIITPPIHLITNYIAYKLGLKEVPW